MPAKPCSLDSRVHEELEFSLPLTAAEAADGEGCGCGAAGGPAGTIAMPDSSSSRGLLGFGYPLVNATLPSAETHHIRHISIWPGWSNPVSYEWGCWLLVLERAFAGCQSA